MHNMMLQQVQSEATPSAAGADIRDKSSGIDLQADQILDIIVGLQGDLVDPANMQAETGRYSTHGRYHQKLTTLTELIMARSVQGSRLLAILKTHPPKVGTAQWYRYQAMLAETVGVEKMHEFLTLAQQSYAQEITAGLPEHCTYGSRGWHPAETVYQMIQGLSLLGRGMNILQTPTENPCDGFGMDGGMAGIPGLALLAEYKKAGIKRVYVHGPFTDSMVFYTVKACRSLQMETVVLTKTTDSMTPEAYQQGLAEIKATGATVL